MEQLINIKNSSKDVKSTMRVLLTYYICFKLINNIMKKGKKDKAIFILNNIIALMSINLNNTLKKSENPFTLLNNVIFSISLPFRLKKKRIAGRNLLIPLFLFTKKQINYSVRFLINSTRERSSKTFELSLFNEIFDILENNSNSVALKKKKEMLRLAIENKYYIKYL